MKNITKIFAAVMMFAVLLGIGCQDRGGTNTESSAEQIPRVGFPEKKIADLNALKWRFIGPMTGTRGSDVIGHPVDKHVFYHAAANGLWKTTDAGATWLPVGDKDFKMGSIGAVSI
jgi:hypothetical protein